MRTCWRPLVIIFLSLLALVSSRHVLAAPIDGGTSSQDVLPEASTTVVPSQPELVPPRPSQSPALSILLDRASALVARRGNVEAQQLYRKALQISPDSPAAHAGLGWTLYDTGKHDLGMKEVQRALALDFNNALAHHYLATMYLYKGRNQEAADEYRMEYKIDPKRRCHCGPIEQILKRYPPSKSNI